MFKETNLNPRGHYVGDCVIRAIAAATGEAWERTYVELAITGFTLADMPSSNHVWGAYLASKGYRRDVIPNTCPDCYTVKDFCQDHPDGTYILATGSHVVAVIDGNYLDTWDSGEEVPIYFWKEEDHAE